MNSHKNAALTPRGRAHLIERIELVGLMPAAEAAGIRTDGMDKMQIVGSAFTRNSSSSRRARASR